MITSLKETTSTLNFDFNIVYVWVGFLITILTFLINAYATYKNTLARKLSNYHEIVKSHRDIWKMTIDDPISYARILENDVDLINAPITYKEKRFVQFVLLHMSSTYNFLKQSEMMQIEQTKYDFDDFLSLPIPKEVWKNTKHFYNRDFVKFVDRKNICLMKNIAKLLEYWIVHIKLAIKNG